ncbi:MAG: HPr family phosphocarrier protein [Desulfosalsimonadaceae bacterium]
MVLIYNNIDILTEELKIEVIVRNSLGLHARPAALIAKLAMKANSGIWLTVDSETVDASSIIDILSLACTDGARVTIAAENESDIEILREIRSLFDKGFDE